MCRPGSDFVSQMAFKNLVRHVIGIHIDVTIFVQFFLDWLISNFIISVVSFAVALVVMSSVSEAAAFRADHYKCIFMINYLLLLTFRLTENVSNTKQTT